MAKIISKKLEAALRKAMLKSGYDECAIKSTLDHINHLSRGDEKEAAPYCRELIKGYNALSNLVDGTTKF